MHQYYNVIVGPKFKNKRFVAMRRTICSKNKLNGYRPDNKPWAYSTYFTIKFDQDRTKVCSEIDKISQ